MSKFFDLYDSKQGLSLEFGHNSVADYILKVSTKKDGVIINIQHCDIEFVLSKAYVDLAEWLFENRDGY